MIVTNLENATRYESLHSAFKQVFDYVKANDLLNTVCGKIVLDGDNLFINNVELTGLAQSEQVLEVHRTYIDIHILLEGEEIVGWKALEDVENMTKVYSSEDDCALSDDIPTSYTKLKAGGVVIVYPEDLHAPVIGVGNIRKLIAKIKL